MICVTGASGTLSSEVIRQLEARAPFRAAYFSDRAAETARARGIDAVVIDYNHPETLRAAFQGCDAVFLLGPNALNQTELELNAVDAAKAAGVRHIVKQSVMGAAEEAYSLANDSPAGREGHRGEWLGLDVSQAEQLHAERRHLHGADDQGRRCVLQRESVRPGSVTWTCVTSPRWR